jgi:hypothetical protein
MYNKDESQEISGDAIANYLLHGAAEIFNFRANDG